MELQRSEGLLLDEGRPVADGASVYRVADPSSDEIAAPQFVVDGKLGQGSVPYPLVLIEKEAGRPCICLKRPRFSGGSFI